MHGCTLHLDLLELAPLTEAELGRNLVHMFYTNYKNSLSKFEFF
jgi:hypothetical protein